MKTFNGSNKANFQIHFSMGNGKPISCTNFAASALVGCRQGASAVLRGRSSLAGSLHSFVDRPKRRACLPLLDASSHVPAITTSPSDPTFRESDYGAISYYLDEDPLLKKFASAVSGLLWKIAP